MRPALGGALTEGVVHHRKIWIRVQNSVDGKKQQPTSDENSFFRRSNDAVVSRKARRHQMNRHVNHHNERHRLLVNSFQSDKRFLNYEHRHIHSINKSNVSLSLSNVAAAMNEHEHFIWSDNENQNQQQIEQ